MYDYYLGGKDNFPADREAAGRALAVLPGLRRSAIENRRFLRRVVRHLTAEAGIGQFLDIGAGLPTREATHQIAHELNPAVRVGYVDYDPMVISHAHALLTEKDLSVAVQEDLREPARLLANPVLRAHLDFGQPVAILLLAVLHFVSDDAGPAGILARIRDAVAPGSYLVISHASQDLIPDKAATAKAIEIYQKVDGQAYPRGLAQIRALFDGWELIPPGVVPKLAWNPVAGRPLAPEGREVSYAGVARKPGQP